MWSCSSVFCLLLVGILAYTKENRDFYYKLQYFHDGSKPFSIWNWPFAALVSEHIDCSLTPMDCEVAGFEDGAVIPEIRLMSKDNEEEFARFRGDGFLENMFTALVNRNLILVSDFMTPDYWEIYHLQNLDQFNLISKLKGKTFLVFFHNPGCLGCSSVEPVMNSFSRTFSTDAILTFFIDCSKMNDFCRNLGVYGVPALKVYAHNQWFNYQGDLDVQELAYFVQQASRPVLERVDLLSFGKLYKQHPVYFLLLLPNTKIEDGVRRVAEELALTTKFVWSTDSRIIGGVDIPPSGTLVIFKGDYTYYYNGDLRDYEKVKTWASRQQFLPFNSISVFAFEQLFNGDRTLLLCDCHQVDEGLMNETYNKLKAIANRLMAKVGYDDQLVIGKLEPFPVLEKFYERKFGQRNVKGKNGTRQCKLLFYDPKTKLSCWKDANGKPIEIDRLEEAIQDFKAGKLLFTKKKDVTMALIRYGNPWFWLGGALIILALWKWTANLAARHHRNEERRRPRQPMKSSLLELHADY